MSHDWTPERIAILTRYVSDGITYDAIAAEMGITKNMCVGKAHRLGLAKRYPTPKRTLTKIRGLLGIGCRFISGEPNWTVRGDAIYCGKPQQEGSSYCPSCHARVYSKQIRHAIKLVVTESRLKALTGGRW